ncbi:MAG: D-alanyl-D-alanine carboxypeptidase [Lachnospiraceae bacterium]|nr:D-alanyl-D-alanine carboxypeptidase [Lachnospiraceae bacterium]
MQRIKQMQEEKQRQLLLRRKIIQGAPYAAAFALLILVIWLGVSLFGNKADKAGDNEVKADILVRENASSAEDSVAVNDSNVINPVKNVLNDLAQQGMSEAEAPFTAEQEPKHYEAEATGKTIGLGDEIISKYAVLIDLDHGDILARKGSKEIISPASMTKILTVLVAAESLGDAKKLDDEFTMTLEVTDYGYVRHCSSAGFEAGETVTVRDLFYGTILPSGADAAVGLAVYTAGSQEAFVELMNKKLEQMGLSKTAHMTNCVGVYDAEHYCTIYDIAMILEAAIDNQLCREILAAHTYQTSETAQHPDGLLLSNWFLRRIEDHDTGGEVICGKTGYVEQSGSCAASYGLDHDGNRFICVTADATSQWKCIEDHVTLYKQFASEESLAKNEMEAEEAVG